MYNLLIIQGELFQVFPQNLATWRFWNRGKDDDAAAKTLMLRYAGRDPCLDGCAAFWFIACTAHHDVCAEKSDFISKNRLTEGARMPATRPRHLLRPCRQSLGAEEVELQVRQVQLESARLDDSGLPW